MIPIAVFVIWLAAAAVINELDRSLRKRGGVVGGVDVVVTIIGPTPPQSIALRSRENWYR